jgi:hypothetical protein
LKLDSDAENVCAALCVLYGDFAGRLCLVALPGLIELRKTAYGSMLTAVEARIQSNFIVHALANDPSG